MSNRNLEYLERYSGIILFLIFAIVGILTYKNYPVSWDEGAQRMTGRLNYEFIHGENEHLLKYKDRDYGPIFELIPETIIRNTTINEYREEFYIRHAFIHGLFLLAALMLWRLVYFLYGNGWLASVAFLALTLHPRLYAHSFFNSKDLPFLSMFIISYYISALAFDKKKWFWFLLLGMSTGALINIRIMGILLLVLVVFFLIIDGFNSRSKPAPSIQETLTNIGVYLVATCSTLYFTWPFLWSSPVNKFLEAFRNMSKFRWGGEVLFGGDYMMATNVKWLYAPVWFGVTTPILFLIIGILGIILLIFSFVKRPLTWFDNTKERNNLFYLACFLGPILAVIILKSVLYDGWRQLYFIYPSFLLLMIYGANELGKRLKLNYVLVLFSLSFVYLSCLIYQFHPISNVYFNYLVSHKAEAIRQNWDYDYWGISYGNAHRYILENDNRAKINVAVASGSREGALIMFDEADRERIQIVAPEVADYFITNYRHRPERFTPYTKSENSIKKFKLQNSTVIEIFKLK